MKAIALVIYFKIPKSLLSLSPYFIILFLLVSSQYQIDAEPRHWSTWCNPDSSSHAIKSITSGLQSSTFPNPMLYFLDCFKISFFQKFEEPCLPN